MSEPEKSKYILIIADSINTRSLLGAQLKEEGFEALGAADLEEAAFMLSRLNEVPSLVVLDGQDLTIDPRALDVLNVICANVPLLLVHGMWDRPELKWSAEVYEQPRPTTISEIVEKIKGILAARG